MATTRRPRPCASPKPSRPDPAGAPRAIPPRPRRFGSRTPPTASVIQDRPRLQQKRESSEIWVRDQGQDGKKAMMGMTAALSALMRESGHSGVGTSAGSVGAWRGDYLLTGTDPGAARIFDIPSRSSARHGFARGPSGCVVVEAVRFTVSPTPPASLVRSWEPARHRTQPSSRGEKRRKKVMAFGPSRNEAL